jgi:hypothetical protein
MVVAIGAKSKEILGMRMSRRWPKMLSYAFLFMGLWSALDILYKKNSISKAKK